MSLTHRRSSLSRSSDERLSIDFATWARPEFDAKQKAGYFTANMDSCPVLSVNGVVIGQSKAIARLVAKKLGFFGASDVEAAQIDCIADHGYEMNDAFSSHTAGKKDDELEAAKGTFAVGWFTAAIEKCVGDGGFAVGGKRSLADIVLYYLLDDVFVNRHKIGEHVKTALATCPKLQSIIDGVKSDAAEWIAARPFSPF